MRTQMAPGEFLWLQMAAQLSPSEEPGYTRTAFAACVPPSPEYCRPCFHHTSQGCRSLSTPGPQSQPPPPAMCHAIPETLCKVLGTPENSVTNFHNPSTLNTVSCSSSTKLLHHAAPLKEWDPRFSGTESTFPKPDPK